MQQHPLAAQSTPTGGFAGESLWQGEAPMRFVYQAATSRPDRLLVAFSAFPALYQAPRYYSIKVLKDVGCHKLFLLDDQGPVLEHPRGCYYLGENRSLAVARTAQDLINTVIDRLEIAHDATMTCGSSKGGSAALYFAARCGLRHAIVGEPQSLLGRYLVTDTPEDHTNRMVARYIAGGTESDAVAYLDDVIPQALHGLRAPLTVHLHRGDGGSYHRRQIDPLVELLVGLKIEFEVDVGPYTRHADMIEYFPPFVQRTVLGLLRLSESEPG